MKTFWKISALFFVFIFLANVSVLAADKGNFSTAPKTNNGEKWRLGYYEGGEYIDYQRTLLATVRGLINLGWIEPTEIPEQKGEQTKELWNWLIANGKSKYVEFVKDAHYSVSWDKELRKKTAEEIVSRLSKKKDIDLIFAMGTWAGKDLANNKHQTPTMVLSTAEPVSAGIIKSVEDSGYDHVHARVDPHRYERQIMTFHDIMKFKKLGVTYENTPTGRSYASIDKVEKVAKERNFEIIRCYTASDIATDAAEEGIKKCFKELVKKTDAIYVAIHGGVTSKSRSLVGEITQLSRQDLDPTVFYGEFLQQVITALAAVGGACGLAAANRDSS